MSAMIGSIRSTPATASSPLLAGGTVSWSTVSGPSTRTPSFGSESGGDARTGEKPKPLMWPTPHLGAPCLCACVSAWLRATLRHGRTAGRCDRSVRLPAQTSHRCSIPPRWAPGGVTPPLNLADAPVQTLKRNENRCSRPSSVVVGDSRRMRSDLRLCADPAVGGRWRRTVSAGLLADCLRTAGQVERPLVRAASNSVRATCSAFSVAAAPTGFAS